MNDLTKRRLVLLQSARTQIDVQMGRMFTEDQRKDLGDGDNVFAYANVNSELRMRVRGRVLKFNTLPELEVAMKVAFPDVAVVA